MFKEFCFLLLLVLSAHISSLALKSESKLNACMEEYGHPSQGTSISLKKTKRDLDKTMSLLSMYQDTIVDYHVYTVEEYDPKKEPNSKPSHTVTTTEIRSIPLTNYKNTQVFFS
jgi:hypothetical protein